MKKIMFNDKYGLTKAVLEGRKTMTRRIVPQCVLNKVPEYQEQYYAGALESISVEDAILNMIQYERMFGNIPRAGEAIAIAQRYSELSWDARFYERLKVRCERLPQYELAGWGNKMFVKPELMPNAILMTSLRVEHLQDISDEDCLREGIKKIDVDGREFGYYGSFDGYTFDGASSLGEPIFWRSPRKAFAALIDRVSKRGTWDSNPLVLAYELKLVK